ncbi:MAG: hypothetical protein R3E95_02605 [Thiolinea sp.]
MSMPNLKRFPVHLGLGATATREPEFTGGLDWYQAYAERHAGDGAEGRLVSLHHFSEPWDMWEMHPVGSELVVCLTGSLRLYQEQVDGSVTGLDLQAGEYAINPAGIWHTMDVNTEVSVLFITAGQGTQHRAR